MRREMAQPLGYRMRALPRFWQLSIALLVAVAMFRLSLWLWRWYGPTYWRTARLGLRAVARHDADGLYELLIPTDYMRDFPDYMFRRAPAAHVHRAMFQQCFGGRRLRRYRILERMDRNKTYAELVVELEPKEEFPYTPWQAGPHAGKTAVWVVRTRRGWRLDVKQFYEHIGGLGASFSDLQLWAEQTARAEPEGSAGKR